MSASLEPRLDGGAVESKDMTSGAPVTRVYALDAARGLLMVLGILLHASSIYVTRGAWLISDPDQSVLFDLIRAAIHSFRMPAFFWVAGYFAALTFVRRGPRALLTARLRRVGIPLLSTLLTLNVVQALWLGRSESGDLLARIWAHLHIGHLWFLADLLVYVGLLVVSLNWLRRSVVARWLRRLPGPWSLVVVLALVNGSALLVVHATGVAYVEVLGISSLDRLTHNFVFFLAGAAMFLEPRVRVAFFRVPSWVFLIVVPVCVLLDPHLLAPGRLESEASTLLYLLGSWLAVAALLGGFWRVVQGDSRIASFLVDASLSIYLFHHLVVIVLGSLLTGVNLPVLIKFALVAGATLVITAALHSLVVRRFSVIRLLFNGRR
ncbi:MAG: acyltransferase family protein [Burkholderiaceae bacterium]